MIERSILENQVGAAKISRCYKPLIANNIINKYDVYVLDRIDNLDTAAARFRVFIVAAGETQLLPMFDEQIEGQAAAYKAIVNFIEENEKKVEQILLGQTEIVE